MFHGGSVLGTRPERHLASIGSIEDVALDAGSGLIELSNLVRWVFHESGKVVHGAGHCCTARTRFATVDRRPSTSLYQDLAD
jgi:hypothetical protein